MALLRATRSAIDFFFVLKYIFYFPLVVLPSSLLHRVSKILKKDMKLNKITLSIGKSDEKVLIASFFVDS